MCVKNFSLTFLCLLGFSEFLLAQSPEDQAYDYAVEAVSIMDQGQIDAAIELLEKAIELDDRDINYPYEMAYAYYLKEDYTSSSKILKKLLKHQDVNDRVYQLLGNSYDYLGKADKSIETYDAGLGLFPQSGILHLERGNMEIVAERYADALYYYEEGIKVQPQFPSNYYWAAKLYLSSTEEVWGMIYGEIFLNLEPATRRSEEISKMIFDTYNSEIQFTSDTSSSVSFSQTMMISPEMLSNPDGFKPPFSNSVYEIGIVMSILDVDTISIATLNRMRSTFIDFYFDSKYNEDYPNILFDYQKFLKDKGHLEAYNYWVLSSGNIEEFNIWLKENSTEWDDFVDFFNSNSIRISDINNFHRTQY